jgi:glutamine phosphoribosylpyrophosphate amidotransferase
VKPGDRLDVVALSRELVLGIEHRGQDATGVAWSDAEGIWWDKAPVKASKYVRRMPLSPLAHTVILHTRFATGGREARPEVNENNHPFALPGVTGIHNGVIWNTAELFEGVGAVPETGTDSEAVFAALAYRGETARTDILRAVKGDATLAWLETDLPEHLFLARLQMRPLIVAQTAGGSILFASESSTIKIAAQVCNVEVSRFQVIPEWTYLAFRRGEPRQVIRMTRQGNVDLSKGGMLAPAMKRAAWDDPRDWVDPRLALGTPGAERHARKANKLALVKGGK